MILNDVNKENLFAKYISLILTKQTPQKKQNKNNLINKYPKQWQA